MKIRKMIFSDEEPARKNARDLQDWDDDEQEPVEEWEPPNYYWVYSGAPQVTKKMFNNMDPKLKTGLHNLKTRCFDSMGRYGEFQDWAEVPQYWRDLWGLQKYGPSYTSVWKLYFKYIGYANYPYDWWYPIKETMNPEERNIIWGITDFQHQFWDHINKEWAYPKMDIIPISNPNSSPTGVFDPFWKRSTEWYKNGMGYYYEKDDEAHYTYREISPACRTIKTRIVH